MKTLSLSKHAAKRSQQRGLSPLVIDCLKRYGRTVHDHHGCVIRHFTKDSLRQIEREWGKESARRLLHDQRNAFAVFAQTDGHVVTTGWLTKRVRQ